MSTTEVAIRRPQRWDTAFGERLTDAELARLLAMPPFDAMDPARFPKSCPLMGLLQNDARRVSVKQGDIVVREGDYGNSAFILLGGSLRVLLESLPQRLLGRAERRRKSLLATAIQNWFGQPIPEVRAYGSLQLDSAIGRRQEGDAEHIFLQDVPGVLRRHKNLQLQVGDIFGELSAITRTPRTATVVADEPAELLEIRWQGLRDLMRYDPALKTRIDALYRQNSLESHLRETPVLRHVAQSALAEIAAAAQFESYGRFDWNVPYRTVAQQDVSERIMAEPLIVEEGTVPDGLFLIRSGFARVSRCYGQGHQTLAYLGKGKTFCLDELAYAWKTGQPMPMLSSLRAVGYVDVLRIPRAVVEAHVLPELNGKFLAKTVASIRQHAEQLERFQNARLRQRSTEVTLETLEFLLDERLINGREAMVINMDRCTRCDDCIRACADTHDNNPRFVRQGPQFGKFMLAQACMHCVDPVCMIGCPTGAIARDAASGNVLINDLTCIGCSTCANSCPYGNISMVETRNARGEPIRDCETQQPIIKATKCDLCLDAWGGPACQRACPHDALVRIDISNVKAIGKWLQQN